MPFLNRQAVVKENPLISVVMTTYNGAHYLAEQIDSILSQTYCRFELIIADDCSTDRTAELLADYSRRDQRIRYYVNDRNLGVNDNLERALTQVCGELIAIADQDDIWEPRKLEILSEHIGDCSAVYSNSLLIDSEGQSLGMTLMDWIRVTPAQGRAPLMLVRKNCVSGHALLFKKVLLKVVLPFETHLLFDQQLGIVAALNDGLKYLDQPLVRHRFHDRNQTNGRKKIEYRGNKAERCDRRRSDLVRSLGFFLRHFERNQDHYRYRKEALALQRKVSFLMKRMREFDAKWFDPWLFLYLVRIRNELFYASETNTFKRCLNYAKGTRYYR
jgi:glycosyltransferase involved in cell wall biosynthesis